MPKQCSVSKKINKDGKEILVCDSTRRELLPRLQKIQKEKGYISDKDMQDIADEFGIHPVEVHSVVTFYSFLSTKKQGKHIIRVSTCMPCESAGSNKVIEAFEKALGIKAGEKTNDGEFSLEKTSCIGMCDQAPAIMADEFLIGNVSPDKVKNIIDEIKSGKLPLTGQYKPQTDKRKGAIIFSDYENYSGIKKALKLKPAEVISQVKDSGIKGRGGAGFPVSLKWTFAANEPSTAKYVVCNADEGEPGTFKDRVLLTEYAVNVFEGMIIAGYAIGAKKGIMYLRGEYISFLAELEKTLDKMRKDNVLGNNILNKNIDFDIEIRLGSGAYVCGEETALIESLESYRGEPRNRPPFPVNTGYFGNPTVVNNVETLTTVIHVLANGSDAFKKYGTEKSTGTKLISISGDCANPGVYEIPYGTTINELLKLIDAKNILAIQVRGAGGRCITEKDFKKHICFEDTPTGGSIIIFDKTRNLLDVAKNFLEFFKEESCGQCTPCREGIPVLLEFYEKIKNNKLTKQDKNNLYSLAETMQSASKCGLGQSAPNTFLDILNIKEV